MKNIVSFLINLILLIVVLVFNFVPALIPNITVQAILLIIAGILVSQLLESTTMFSRIDSHLQKLIEQKNFTSNDLVESMTLGFEKCKNHVSILRIFAISSTKILSIIELKNDIHIENCKLMVRKFGSDMSELDQRFNCEIEENIQRWKTLEQKGVIKKLEIVRYNSLPYDFCCIFDKKFLALGVYSSNQGDISRVSVEGTFSITDSTASGKALIEKYTSRFTSFFK